MAGKQWGALCPDGHGLLYPRDEWTSKGVIWCPHEDHGGNGRFWRLTEVEEGWFDPTGPIRKTQAQIERQEAAQERSHAWQQTLAEQQARQRKVRRMTTDTTGTTPAKKAAEPRDCLCGCGLQTKGGRFIPGHDARYHGRTRKLEAAGMSHDEAEAIASQGQTAFDAAYAKIAPAPAPKPEKPAKATADGAAPTSIGVPKPTSRKRSRKEQATSAPTADEQEAGEDIPLE